MNSTELVENVDAAPYPNSPGGGRDMTDVVFSCPKSLWEENPEPMVLLFELLYVIDFTVPFSDSVLFWSIEGEPITPDRRRSACCRLLFV